MSVVMWRQHTVQQPVSFSAEPLTTFFFFQAEDGIRDGTVTGVQTCALPICSSARSRSSTSCLLVLGYVVEFSSDCVSYRSEERRVGKECRFRGWPER